MSSNTVQQERIKEEFVFTNNNIFISACPGAGKTHTLKMLSKLVPEYKKVIFLAFNKSIADELRSKLPEHVECCTIHSKAYSILRKNIRVNARLYDLKKFVLFKKLKSENKNIKNSELFHITNIVNLTQMNCVNPNDEEELRGLCNMYGEELSEGDIKDVQSLFISIDNHDISDKNAMIDFTDMLYLTNKLVSKDKYPKYDVVMLDEAQDVCPLQREFLLKLLKPSGRLVIVGDEKQCIYSFQGSNLDSFNYLKSLPKTTVLPLSVSFRCGKNIVKEAHKCFTEIEAHENNPEGVVRNGKLSEAQPGDFVICRNNLPLIFAFIELITLGKKTFILGKDLEKNLLNLLSDLGTDSSVDILLNDKILKLKESGVTNPEKHKSYIEFKEKCDILKVLISIFGSIERTKSKMREMFDGDTSNSITLMTCHKSKGLESDRCFFLNSDLIPSKYAVTELDMYQEKCLKFVTITRAKKELVYCKIKV